MPIRQRLKELGGAFEPPQIDAMASAYSKACAALSIAESDSESRQIVATRIIDLARDGLASADELYERVMTESAKQL